MLDSSRRPRKDADGERAKEVLARHAGIKDPKILDISYEDFRQLSPANIEPTKAAAENIMAQFPDASRNVGDYVDLSILDELTKDGVFTVLQQKYPRCAREERHANEEAGALPVFPVTYSLPAPCNGDAVGPFFCDKQRKVRADNVLPREASSLGSTGIRRTAIGSK